MAGTTRLELATSAVTGQRSNQLNYVPTLFSYTSLETHVFTGFPHLPQFPLLPPFPRRITNFVG